MQIECSHHVDASEPDADGSYDYYYEYDFYRFAEEGRRLFARSYTDSAEEAHFLSMEVGEVSRLLTDNDLVHPLFLAACAYLRREGKTQLTWLSGRGNGYEDVPSSALSNDD